MTENHTLAPVTVTVVVPNYNHARYLPQCLGSIAAQTRPPLEVIVIDDGSTDNSVQVIEGFIADRSDWRLIRNAERGGVVSRLNDGIAQAKGGWVVFLGADDGLLPHFIERAVEQAQKSPRAGLVSACAVVVNGSGRSAARPAILPCTKPDYITAGHFRDLLATSDNFFNGTVTLYRREALAGLGGFDPALSALTDGFAARRLAARLGFGFIPEVLGYWRHHGANLSVVTANDHAVVEKIIGCARDVLASEPAGLFPSNYSERFERRVRFGWARQLILDRNDAPGTRAGTVADLLSAGRLERSLLRMAMGSAIGSVAALAWITLRQWPVSLVRLGIEPLRRGLLARQINASLRNMPVLENLDDIGGRG